MADVPGFFQFVDVITVVFALLFFTFARLTLREQLRVTQLMNTEVETDEEDDGTVRIPSGDLDSFSQKGSSVQTTDGMKSTAWDQLTWEERMQHSRRQNVLNWVSAAFGALALMGGLFWSYVAVMLDVEGALGTVGLVAFGVVFAAMAVDLAVKFRRQYTQSGAADRDSAMQTSLGRGSLDRWILAAIAIFLLGSFVTDQIIWPLLAIAVLFGVRHILIRRRTRPYAEEPYGEEEEDQ